jgi:3-hydroxyacyl-[acyl-carrier-protein] dehydratase
MTDAVEFDPTTLDFTKPLAGIDEIRAVNPHRFEFEMLTGIVLLDPARKLVAGFKDLGQDEFWARGHMPGFPLLPGVLMCEAAAQLCNYFNFTQKVHDPDMLMGLGGIEDARFHRPVRPGDRLVMIGFGERVHRRMTKFRVMGFVRAEKVFEALVIGVPLGKWEELKGA